MNEDILKGQWTQIRGQVKQWWGMLTDDDLNKINGKRDQYDRARLQERYGYSKEQAVKQLDERLAEFQRMMAAPHH